MRVDFGNDELNDLIERLRKRLGEYLKSQGVFPDDHDLSKPFKCIAPGHEDSNPSMSFIPRSEGTRIRCWSCGRSADIFQTATWLEGLPGEGAEWVKENVYHLARTLEEEFHEVEPTPAELSKAKILQLYADAADCLVGLCKIKPDLGYKHTRTRGLKDDVCFEMGVGTVDFNEFIETVQRYGGWTKEYVLDHLPYEPQAADKTDKEYKGRTHLYFGQDFITFTLRDHRGVVIGFDRRFVHYSSEDEKAHRKLGKSYPKKFLLPYKTEIFNPEIFLYNLDRAKDNNWKMLDVVEGYFDVISGVQAGHRCIVGACGTSTLKEVHLELLHKLDFREICLVMDSDEPGLKAMERYLNEFGSQTKMRISFRYLGWDAQIPDKDKDPDMFFRLYCKDGLEEYDKIPTLSAFTVSLMFEQKKGTTGEALARAQIPHIASEPDALRRGKMIEELAKKTGCDKIDIREAVDVILTGKSKNIARDLTREIERGTYSPRELMATLTKAQQKLGPLFGGSADLVSKRAAEATFHEAIDRFYSKRGALAGYRTDIPLFDEKFGGVQKGLFMAVAGNPNSGKSAMLYAVIAGLMKNYQENKDLCVVLFSFDDLTSWSWAKLIAAHSGLDIKYCAEPQRYILHDKDLTRKYQESQAFYRSILKEHLWVFGGDIGPNMNQMDKAIKNAQDSTGKHVLVVVDSFNKVQGVDGLEGTTKFERNADGLHALVHNGLSVITSAETVKNAMGKKPNMGNMKDTSKLAYNANVVLLVYNPLHELREKSNFFWVREESDKPGVFRKSAVIQTDIWKNRMSDYKGSDVFQFNDHIGTFEHINDINKFMRTQRQFWATHGVDNIVSDDGKESPFDGMTYE